MGRLAGGDKPSRRRIKAARRGGNGAVFPVVNNSYSILNDPRVLNGVYEGLGIRIQGTIAGMFLENADAFTGYSLTLSSIQSFLEDNRAKTQNVSAGLALVQDNQDKLSEIRTKVAEIETLAETAAGGSLSPTELAEAQDQVGQLALEIDQLAQGTFGQPHLLREDGDRESIVVSSALTVTIETHDMTANGLGVEGLDVINDAAGAIQAAQGALEDIDAYRVYLDTKTDVLEAAATALNIQRTSLEATQSAIESTEPAMAMVGMLAGLAPTHAGIFLAAQANATSDTVLALLSD